MQISFHPLTLPLFLSALILLSVALLVLQRARVKGALPLAVLLMGLSIWAGAYAVMWSLTALAVEVLWLRLAYTAIIAVPLSLLLFVAQITDNDRLLTKTNVALLALEPVVTLFVIWTSQSYFLYYAPLNVVAINSFLDLSWQRGAWFWVNAVYYYLLIFIAIVMLIRAILRAGLFARVQLGTILLGCLLPLGANVYATSFPSAFADLVVTPISFAVSGLIFAYALFRQRFLDIVPVARSVLIEKMSNGVLVLDMRGRILDVNLAAMRIMQIDEAAFGRDIREVYPALRLAAEPSQDFESSFELESSHPSRFFEVSSVSLRDGRGRENGRLISLLDVTERKRAEIRLQAMNARLQRQLRKISSLRDELQEQAIRDPLTGLFNRRYLAETLERELSRSKRRAFPMSLIMLDIDHFKQVNDTYGHKAGDRVLRSLGEMIRTHIRGSDVPCRFGGEEFVILLPDTTFDTSAQRAEHIRAEFQALAFFKGKDAIVPTLSLGVADFRGRNPKADNVLQAADRALYAAKAQGGNAAFKDIGKGAPIPVVKQKAGRRGRAQAG